MVFWGERYNSCEGREQGGLILVLVVKCSYEQYGSVITPSEDSEE